jgi:RND family efflux transporter MFP subunit
MTPTPPSRLRVVVFLPLLLVGAAVLIGCRPSADGASAQSADRAGPDAVPVRTAPVVQEARALPIRTSGRLARKAEMTLSFKIGGFVEEVRVDEGDRVRKGQGLAHLDLEEINAQVQRAEANLAKARRDLRRAKALYQDSVATLEEKQNAQTAVDVAASDLQVARFNKQHSTIVAPADGQILQRMAEENEHLPAGAPVFEFGAETEGWVMRVGLADEDVVTLRLGSPAEVQFDAFPEEAFEARVTEIADAAEPISGTFEVELQIADPEGKLKSGLIGKADITPVDTQRYFFVPTSAIVEGDGQFGVVYGLAESSRDAAEDAHRVERRSVRIERILGEQVAIRSGLDGVERVVTRGGPYLEDGAWARTVSRAPTVAEDDEPTAPMTSAEF